MSKFENIKFARSDDNKLTMEVDLEHIIRSSATGKSDIVAETKGIGGLVLKAREGGELCRVKVLVYKVKGETEEADVL